MKLFVILMLGFYSIYAVANEDFSNNPKNAIEDSDASNLYIPPRYVNSKTKFKVITILVLDEKNKKIESYFKNIADTVGKDYIGTKVYYGNANKSYQKIKKIAPSSCFKTNSFQSSSYVLVYKKNEKKCYKLNFDEQNIMDIKRTFDYIFKNIKNINSEKVDNYKCKQSIGEYLNKIKASTNVKDIFAVYADKFCNRLK